MSNETRAKWARIVNWFHDFTLKYYVGCSIFVLNYIKINIYFPKCPYNDAPQTLHTHALQLNGRCFRNRACQILFHLEKSCLFVMSPLDIYCRQCLSNDQHTDKIEKEEEEEKNVCLYQNDVIAIELLEMWPLAVWSIALYKIYRFELSMCVCIVKW